MSWSSHKIRRSVRSIVPAEILSARESIDEGKVIAVTLSEIFGTRILLHIGVDSKDLYQPLKREQNTV